MNKNYLNKLEYDKILDLLAKNSITYVGKDLCLNLLPSFKEAKVTKLLQETLEASNLIYRKGNLPITDISNIYISIKNLESSYSLNAKSLLDIAKTLKLSRELKEYLYKDQRFLQRL